MTLDERIYKDPFKFDPERFLPAPLGRGEPVSSGPFGFGRRICPGRHLADDSLWIAMATILSALSILKAVGKDGNDVVPDVTSVTTGITSRPTAFPCRIEPRNVAAATLIKQIAEMNNSDV